MEKLRIQQEQTLGSLETKIDATMERRTRAIMDRLDGLLGSRGGSTNGESNSGEPSREPRVNSMSIRIGEGHMDPLEEGAVHQAMPQGTKEHGARTSEEVQLATDRPQMIDRRKIHMRLGDVIPGTGVMRVKEETIPATKTGRKTRSPYQGAVILKRGNQETLYQWPQPLNL